MPVVVLGDIVVTVKPWLRKGNNKLPIKFSLDFVFIYYLFLILSIIAYKSKFYNKNKIKYK